MEEPSDQKQGFIREIRKENLDDDWATNSQEIGNVYGYFTWYLVTGEEKKIRNFLKDAHEALVETDQFSEQSTPYAKKLSVLYELGVKYLSSESCQLEVLRSKEHRDKISCLEMFADKDYRVEEIKNMNKENQKAIDFLLKKRLLEKKDGSRVSLSWDGMAIYGELHPEYFDDVRQKEILS